MADDLVIRISGDIKGYEEALEQVTAKTEALSGKLSSAAKVAGVAFAALTAEIGLSVKAYAESEEASKMLILSMKNQGIFSKQLEKDYRAQAAAIQDLTGIDDDAVIAGNAHLQSLIGQTEITLEMTEAIADLSIKTGSYISAAEIVGRAFAGNTKGLKQFNISIDENLTKSERQAKVLEALNVKFGGLAEESNKGLGGLKGLSAAFGDLQEEIGRRFAPAMEFAIRHLTSFFQMVSRNSELVGFISGILAAGAAITGMVAVLGSLGVALIAAKAFFVTLGIASTAILGPLALVAAAIGLVVGGLTYMAVQSTNTVDKVDAVDKKIAELRQGLTALEKIKFNPFPGEDVERASKDIDMLKAKIADLEETKRKLNTQERTGNEDPTSEDRKKADAAKAFQQEQDRERSKALRERNAEEQAKLEERLAMNQNHSSEYMAIIKEQNEIEKQLRTVQNEELKEELMARHAELTTLKEEQFTIDQEQERAFQEEILANNEEYQAMTVEQQALFREQNQEEIQKQTLDQNSLQQKMAKDRADVQTKSNNQFLIDQAKFGTAYAYINQAMNSAIFQGNKQAFGELAQLQQSSNATLKQIGKVAAIANIVIKTAESAMNIFNGFSTIPIVGIPLGLAGAAAAVAFGAEQIGKVTAAADGGLLTGGIAGVDSIPVLAQQGELISPTSNFEEVIGSVRAARAAESIREETGFGGGGGTTQVLIGFDGKEASQFLTVKQIEDRALGVSQESVG